MPEKEIRVQVPVSEEVVLKIDELAEKMNVGRGRMAAMLLETAIEDNEWIINCVTSKMMEPVLNTVKKWKRKK